MLRFKEITNASRDDKCRTSLACGIVQILASLPTFISAEISAPQFPGNSANIWTPSAPVVNTSFMMPETDRWFMA